MDVKNYKGAIKGRAQQARMPGPAFPKIAQAQQSYSVSRDGDMTPGQLAEQQRSDDNQPPGLSNATIEGLRELKRAEEAKDQEQAKAAPSSEPTAEENAIMADTELVSVLRALRRDPINNEAEKEAVAGRVEAIDISEGLLTGEYTQRVPIVPGKLNVTFRTYNVLEHQMLRLLVIKKVLEDVELQALEGELMAVYQTVAGVKQINDQKFETHLRTGKDSKLEFVGEIFERKLVKFLSMPLPLLGVLGVHATWFDGRVRALFVTSDPLKNG